MAQSYDIILVGSGMGSLSAAALLAKEGMKVLILEQNYLPGGCTSSYWRKGFVFESGATTLVGLDPGMPLRYVLDQTGIVLPARKLELPMQVHLKNGQVVSRYEDLDAWIGEAERVFGGGQKQGDFWRKAFEISRFVWDTSIRQRNFPPSRFGDFLDAARNVRWNQLVNARYSLVRTSDFIKGYGLLELPEFREFVNEQLLITAQNHMDEVNVLFGATALSYTNYGNYYIDGGLINLVTPFLDYIQKHSGEIKLREGVERIEQSGNSYIVHTKKASYEAPLVLSGIPVNNLLDLYPKARNKYENALLDSPQLNSAFQMGIGFKSVQQVSSLHHQIHLKEPLPGVGSASIFLSLSHPDDSTRSDEPGMQVASISTHVPDPAVNIIDNQKAEEAVIKVLEEKGFLRKEDIVYRHSSSPKSWEKWTGRAFGFVGGYPQFFRIKPWDMIEARVDGKGLYQCGDTTYPGQGIPGTTLSGIIAFEKIKKDGYLKRRKLQPTN
jgi:C-3',4' desaturase CrtD